jgi:hypothetical protein
MELFSRVGGTFREGLPIWNDGREKPPRLEAAAILVKV